MDEGIVARSLDALFETQSLAVLATIVDGQPHCNIVAFAHTKDMRCLLFATRRGTRKYASLVEHPKISMLIDNRENHPADFQEAIAVTVDGTARDLGEEKQPYLAMFLDKHPSLRQFASDPSCALICLDIARFKIVSQFSQVQVLER